MTRERPERGARVLRPVDRKLRERPTLAAAILDVTIAMSVEVHDALADDCRAINAQFPTQPLWTIDRLIERIVMDYISRRPKPKATRDD